MDISSSANICTTYDDFDFSKIILTHPESLHSGSFFTKLNINSNMFYIQTPKCISKQGVVTTAGKKSYIDLMFSSDDAKFIEFMENLEKHCIEKIYDKKNSWFTNDIDKSEIENAFTSVLRSFKAGKYYLLRANVSSSKNLLKTPTCFVFDESEKQLSLDDIKPDNDLITVLEIQGIKFTPRSFQFEIIIRQALIMANRPVFQSCVIKKNITTPSSAIDTYSQNNNNTTHESQYVKAAENVENVENVDNKDGEKNENGKKDLDDLKENINTSKSKIIPPPVSESAPVPVPASSSILLLTSKKTEKNINTNTVSKEKEDKENIEDIETIQELTEADLEIKDDESIKLKKPNDIYYEVYRAAKEKARAARKLAFDAYLEVKKIKKTYMLDDSDSDFSDSSDSDDDENSDNEDVEDQ
jgi:hypothetical protein